MASKKTTKAAVRKKKVHGVVAYDIPNEVWKCPDCGVGIPDDRNTDGLVQDETLVDLPEPWMGAEDYVLCYACDWSGSVEDVARGAQEAADQVECPCCHGDGSVASERAETFSQVPPDEAKARRALHIVRRFAALAEEKYSGYTILSALSSELKMARDFVTKFDDQEGGDEG